MTKQYVYRCDNCQNEIYDNNTDLSDWISIDVSSKNRNVKSTSYSFCSMKCVKDFFYDLYVKLEQTLIVEKCEYKIPQWDGRRVCTYNREVYDGVSCVYGTFDYSKCPIVGSKHEDTEK